MSARLTISESGIYKNLCIDGNGYDNAIKIIASNVTIIKPETYGANKEGILTTNDVLANEPDLVNTKIINPYSHDNGTHGIHFYNKVNNGYVIGGLVENNGINGLGHGVSCYNMPQGNFSWLPVSTGVSKAQLNHLNKDIQRVYVRDGDELKMGDVNNLLPQQFAVKGDYLFVNYDTSKKLIAATNQTHSIYYSGVTSMTTQDHNNTEGHGFAFDNNVNNSLSVNCVSLNNKGAAFSVNQGMDNTIINLSEHGNKSGVHIISGSLRTLIK